MRVLVPWKLKCYVGVCTRRATREVAGRAVHVGGRWEGEGACAVLPAGAWAAGRETCAGGGRSEGVDVAFDLGGGGRTRLVGGGAIVERAAHPGLDGTSAFGGGGEGLFAQETFGGGFDFGVFAVADLDHSRVSVGFDEELHAEGVVARGVPGGFEGFEAEGGCGGGAAVEHGRGIVVVGHVAVEIFEVGGQREQAGEGCTLGGGFGFEGFGGERVDGGALFGQDVEGAVGGDVVAVEEVGQIGAEIAYHAAGEVAAVGKDVEPDAEAVDDVARVDDGAALSAAAEYLALSGGADVDAAAFDGLDDAADECGVTPRGCAAGGHDEAVDEGGIAADTPYEMADREGAVGGEALGEPRGVDAHVDIGLEEVAGGEGFAVGAHGEALPRAHGALGGGVGEEVAGLRFAWSELIGEPVFGLRAAPAARAEQEAEREEEGEEAGKVVHVVEIMWGKGSDLPSKYKKTASLTTDD